MKLKQFLSSSKVRCVSQVISHYCTSDSQYLVNTYIHTICITQTCTCLLCLCFCYVKQFVFQITGGYYCI